MSLLLGLIGLIFLALAIIGVTAIDLVRHPPNPTTVAQGAFRCDRSWRLPCDGG
jgi:hypothetical protein